LLENAPRHRQPPRVDPAGLNVANILPEGTRRTVHFQLPNAP